ncbi:uncharacterized protein LACBIDRAFT_335862 [Laccaria bicolor S238N-H82]|uniref:Predicted protein n=1 Tax=Laccaria bicolor (strain S238N-H82 / ATCC MYA-4686) TaxID=486041 RepID=B0E3N1_LACBS|nr:uncharacterized protein LACBIDRAFT_335862 [Laccaria bicolor S238N-H82]EDQ98553.1 predicted protein [Laccaria bicolor S238N-H82]|eukprot:XP_001890799.1 predicted protein [Laccaria bicolor S238N-H82]
MLVGLFAYALPPSVRTSQSSMARPYRPALDQGFGLVEKCHYAHGNETCKPRPSSDSRRRRSNKLPAMTSSEKVHILLLCSLFHNMNEWHNTNVPLHPLLLMLMPTAVSTFCHGHPLEYVGLNNAKMLLSKFLSDIVCTSLLFLCLFRIPFPINVLQPSQE